MNRCALGLRLQGWHHSMSDPTYAVGSYYFDDKKYPRKEVVESCITSLQDELDKQKRMFANEKVSVYNTHLRRQVDDLRAFAGYSDKELEDNIADLEEIISETQRFLEEDYK